MTKKRSYWKRRAINAEKRVNDGAKILETVLSASYRQAQSYLNKQVKKQFNRIQKKASLTEQEAKAMLNETVSPAELTEWQRLAKDITDPQLQQQAKRKLNGLALKSRITRLEDLKAKSYLVSKQVADVSIQKQTEFYIDTIHEAYKEATAENVIRQAQANAKNGVVIEVWNKKDYQFKELSTQYTKDVLETKWKGSNYSKRIWNDTDVLAKRLEQLFTVESMTGMSEVDMTKAIAKEFDQSINVAKRLIRTEANYMANQSKLKAMKNNKVEKYRIVAILDLRTSKICRGQDGKIYLVKDAIIGITLPPFHPHCRSVIMSYFGERSLNLNRTALDPITGKTFTIKGSETYDDWMEKLKSMYSDDEIKLQKKKIKNMVKDNISYKELRNVLGSVNVPSTLDKYQNIKYNEGNEWTNIQDNYFVKSRIKDGRYGSKINSEKQAPHMKSTVGKGKSYFNDSVDVQKLFDKYVGTGSIEKQRDGVTRKNTEIISAKDFEGIAINLEGSYKTNSFKIHHSKKRTHIVPIKEES